MDLEGRTENELAVADEIDVDMHGMVSMELAQQILEDVWSNGQPLEEKRPEIAKRWKQVQRETGKVRFEHFLECYYFEDKTAEPFELVEESSWSCGGGNCPGPWFLEWGFFWAFFLPAAVYVYVVFMYMVGEAEDGQPLVYKLHPEGIIRGSFYSSWASIGLIVLLALVRAHVLGGQSRGVIINGKLVQKRSLNPLKWFLEDNDDAARKEDIGQMSHILGLIVGPFLVVTVIATCLFLVVQGVVMKLDNYGVYMNPQRCLDPVTWVRVDPDPKTGLGCTPEEYEEEIHGACRSPIGYFGTISGVSANIMPQGYVFMFVTISTNALVILTHMPPFGILQGVQDNDHINLSKRQWEEGYFPNKEFIINCSLIRLGLVMTCVTGVLPDFAEGIFKASELMSKVHLYGIGLGVFFALLGITKYMVTAMHLRTTNDNHAKHMDRPILWFPHVITMWVITLTLIMVTGFLIANSQQPRYDNWHNQCLLRSTNIARTPEGTEEACGLPGGFNKEVYRKDSGYPYFDLNLTAIEETDQYPVGYDFYETRAVVSVGPCSYDEDKNCVVIAEKENIFSDVVNEEYVVDGSESPKQCTLSNDGTMCMDRNCNFHEYKIGFTFEFALLFLMMTICQLFVVTFHFDWQIHDPLIVTERAADAPGSNSLKNRDILVLGGADRNIQTIGAKQQ